MLAVISSSENGTDKREISYQVRFTDGGEEMLTGVGGIQSLSSVAESPQAEVFDIEEGKEKQDKYIKSNEDDNANGGGLLTPLCRLSIGSDDVVTISPHELLADIGRLYQKLHDIRTTCIFQFINPNISDEAVMDEDIFYPVEIPADIAVSFNLYSEHGAYHCEDDTAAGHYILSTASKYYTAAFEMAMEEGKTMAANAYINSANIVERMLS